MEGYRRGRNLEKVGWHAQDTAELFFENVRVPVENRLGEEGRGFYYLMEQLPQERLIIAVGALAACEAALDWTITYCKERTAFGRPIGSFQANRLNYEMRLINRAGLPRSLHHGAQQPQFNGGGAAMAKWWLELSAA
jgi:alkylation response protein AidB-like acyl-CoA dehydrogenase